MMKKCCQHTYLKQRLRVQVIVLRGRLLIGDGKGGQECDSLEKARFRSGKPL